MDSSVLWNYASGLSTEEGRLTGDIDGDGTILNGLDSALYASYLIAGNKAGKMAMERYVYDAYGNRTVLCYSQVGVDEMTPAWPSKSILGCDVGHQGLFHDPDTGLIHNRHRMLSPSLGRFMQQDPLGYVDSINLYEYIDTKPVDFLDPSGTKLRDPTSGLDPDHPPDHPTNECDKCKSPINVSSEGMSPADVQSLKEYICGVNKWFKDAGPQQLRPLTDDELKAKKKAVLDEYRDNPTKYPTGKLVAGHLPDTGISRNPYPDNPGKSTEPDHSSVAGSWLPMTPLANSKAGGAIGQFVKNRSIVDCMTMDGKIPDCAK